MRQLDIALALLKQKDEYLFQKRGDMPEIGAAGLIGLFGGKIEGEAPLQAVCRELDEETNFAPDASDAKFVGEVKVVADHKLEDVNINAQIFGFTLSKDYVLRAKEGTLVRFTKQKVFENMDLMTPATRACFENLIGEE